MFDEKFEPVLRRNVLSETPGRGRNKERSRRKERGASGYLLHFAGHGTLDRIASGYPYTAVHRARTDPFTRAPPEHPPPETPPITSGTEPPLSARGSHALRHIVASDQAAVTERIAALGELVTRGESDLDLLISGVLRNTTIDFPLRCALVLYGEQVACPQPSRGAALAEVLLTQAFVLRDAEEADADLPLWAALRRFASLAPLERAAALLDFLRPHDSAPTRQVALQGLQSMLEHEELPAHPETEPLRRRVGELARKYLDADWLTSGENVALAINAFCAAVLLGVPLSEELAHLLLDLGRPRMLRRCHEMLAAAQTARRQRGASRSRVLDTVLALLVEAPSSPRTHADARSRHP